MSTEFFNDQWRIPSNENQNKISNYSMEFNGSSDFINCGDSDNLSFGNGSTDSPFSISAWVNMTDATSFVTIAKDVTSNREYVIRTLTDDKLYIYLLDNVNGGYIGRISSGTVTSYQGTWIHTVYTYNGNSSSSGIKIYLNGSAVDNDDYQGGSYTAMSNTTTSLNIGRQEYGSGTYANGKIDQVTIFDYALSQDQVTQLGAEGYAFNFTPNDYIDANTTVASNLDFSASAWIKPSSYSMPILGTRGLAAAGDSNGITMNINSSGNLWARIFTETSNVFNLQTGGIMPLNAWSHVAMTYDSSTKTLKSYLNGTEAGSMVGTDPSVASTADLDIGRSSVGTAYDYFDGEISNTATFNTELTPIQVQTLYNNGKPGDISSLNPVAWYKLDNNEVFNGAEWSIDNSKYPSVYKSSLNFNGSTQAIDCGTGSRFDIDQIVISAWVRLRSGLTDFQMIGGVRNTNNGILPYMLSQHNNSKFRFLVNQSSDSAYKIIYSNDDVVVNTWYHVMGVADGSSVKMYVNGDLQTDQTTYDGTITSPTQNFNIGRQPSQAIYYLDGQISNVAVFNTGLSQSQVQTIYNNGTPEASISHSPVSWWKLDNTTTGLIDNGSASNNGTNIGTTKYDGFVNTLAGESNGMTSSSLVASDINGELIANPMITSPKPIAYYQLGDQSVDNGANYLVPNNSLSDYVFNFGDGYYDSLVNFGTTTANFDKTDPYTFSIWIKASSNAANQYVISKQIPNYLGYVLLLDSTMKIGAVLSHNSNARIYFVSNSAIPSNEWVHLVWTYNGNGLASGMSVYVNSAPFAITTVDDNLTSSPTNSGQLNISGRNGSFHREVNGELSNFSIFDTELSSTQITTLYNNGAPGDISSLSPTNWYKLDASAVYNSTSTEWSVDNNVYPSVYQSSLDFNGSSNYIDCGNDSSLSISGDLTISAWVYIDIHKQLNGIISKVSSTDTNYEILVRSTKNITFYTKTSGTLVFTSSTTTITANTWTHVAVTVQNGVTNGTKFYFNGVQDATTGTHTVVGNTANLNIGRRTTNEFHMDGKISNVALWNTALSSPEVNTLYNNGTPEASISHSPVSWWKLDNTTTGIQDSAGSNNGTNNGATEYVGFVNELAGESLGMNSANLVVSDLQQTSGYSPYALDFDGTTNKLNLSSIDSTGNKTYSCWIYPTVSGNNGAILTLINSNSDTDFISIALWESEIHALVAVSSTSNNRKNTVQTISANQWYHIAVVKSTGSIDNIYINGANQTLSGSGGWNAGSATSQNQIANADFGSSFGFAGNISNLATWDVALTSTEIIEIYNQGVPSNLNTFSGTAPTAWWQLGSNSSFNSSTWTCLDEIGTNNAVSGANMTNDDIVDGVGYSGSGLGTSSIDIVGDAPYSSANGISEGMDVLDRSTDIPS